MKKDKSVIVIVSLVLINVLFIAGIIALRLRIPQRAIRKIQSRLDNSVTIQEEKVDIENLDKPFNIIYLADTHVVLCDDRDEDVREKSDTRYLEFIVDSKSSDENFTQTMKYIRESKPDLVIFGGDILDSATYEAIEFLQKELDSLDCPYIYLTGNHDFEYGLEYFSDVAYSEYLPRLINITDIDKGYELMEFDSFVVLALDDAGNQLTPDVTEGIKKAEETGKPVIVATHVPFVPFEEKDALVQKSNEVWGGMDSGDSRTLMGYGGIMPNGDTQEMIKFIAKDDSPVKIVLSGHVHFYHKDLLNRDIYQVITGAGYQRNLLKITLY